MITKRNIIGSYLVVLWFLACSASAWAAKIVYNDDGRPVELRGLMVSGQSYHVDVNWTTAQNTYESSGSFVAPKYWGDNAGATVAAEAMRQALLDDGFSPIGLESYLMVPWARSGNIIGPGVYLHDDNLKVGSVAVGYTIYSGQVGFTKFHYFRDGFEGPDNSAP